MLNEINPAIKSRITCVLTCRRSYELFPLKCSKMVDAEGLKSLQEGKPKEVD